LKKTFTSDVFTMPEGSEVELMAWIYTRRLHGGVVFLTIRDSKGLLQVAFKKGVSDPDSMRLGSEIETESSVKLRGVVKKDERAPGGSEIHCSFMEPIGRSIGEFPIRKGASVRFQLDHRHLHLRSPRVAAFMKAKSAFVQGVRNCLGEKGFYEIQCPTLVTAAVEGGATLFPVDYFGRTAYLTQSVQLYQEAAIFGLERVYSLQPSFRAEKSRTPRHLTEFTHLEAEVAFADLDDIMSLQEELVSLAAREVDRRCQAELRFLRKRIDTEAVEPPYPRITYTEALEIMRRRGMELDWGDDLGADEETVLSKEFEKPFFVTSYPREAKGTFYHMCDPKDPRVLRCADLLAPGGYGEIIGGGQRIHDYNQLVESIESWGLNPEDYEWYLDLRRYGSVPHSGFGLGIERTVRWLLGLRHIRDASLFPRTPTRIYP